MGNCRCARCTRKEIYNATGMTLSLAWNKVLGGDCHAEDQELAGERRQAVKIVPKGEPAKRAS